MSFGVFARVFQGHCGERRAGEIKGEFARAEKKAPFFALPLVDHFLAAKEPHSKKSGSCRRDSPAFRVLPERQAELMSWIELPPKPAVVIKKVTSLLIQLFD